MKLFFHNNIKFSFPPLADAEAIDQAVVSQMQKTDTGVWQCATCGWQSKFKTRLYEHVEAKHVETGGYSCPLCEKFCSSKNAFKLHKSKYHRNSGGLVNF